MTQPFYQLQIISVGEYVAQYLQENKFIIFSDPVPQDIADYCVVHRASELTAPLTPGKMVVIDNTPHTITAVGSVAEINLKQLGHITFSFDGASVPELPGTIHLTGAPPKLLQAGDNISFY
jgi:PTS system glucitol/sorbitol-specific IIA component